MANVTWSSTDKSAQVTLASANLSATTSAGNTYVRSISGESTGKYYFEITHTTVGSGSDETGLALVTSNPVATSVGNLYLTASGALRINSSATVVNFGVTITSGTTVCWAVDLDNQRVWVRIGAAGNWNNNAGNSPAIPSTGASFAALGLNGLSLLPFIYFATATSAVLANFGDSAFSGTVPTGFTAGIPDVSNNNAIITQEGVEAWVVGPSAARVTQLGSEAWLSSPSRMQATQIGLEVWRSVSVVVPSTAKPFVVIMA